jgi:hypothetical protein
MSKLESFLSNGIPLHEAADFFIRIKTAGQKGVEFTEDGRIFENGLEIKIAQEDLEEVEKTAGVKVERFLPGTMHHHGAAMKLALESIRPTMFVPDIDLEGNYNTEDEKTAAALKDRTDADSREAGRQRGIGNAASTFESEKHHKREGMGDMAGRMLGGLGGAAMGSHFANQLPGTTPGVQLAGLLGGAALGQSMGGRVGKMVGSHMDANAFGKAASKMLKVALGEPGEIGGLGGAGLHPDPATDAYLQQEMAGQEQEETQSAEYYRNLFQQTHAQLQEISAQHEQLQQQADQLQQQAEQSQAQVEQALQQGQQMQQQSLNNIQQANASATQAMQQTMGMQSELLSQQQLATQMRTAYEGIRGQAMQMATQEPPPALTPAGQSQADAAAGIQQDTGMGGAPMAGAPAGTPPGGAAADPTAIGQAQQGPAQSAEEPTPAAEEKPTTPKEKEAASLGERALAGAGGAAVGALGTHLMNQKGSDGVKSKVQKLEGRNNSFGQALDLAQAKMRLALSEVGEKHPVGSMLAGGLMTAGLAAGGADQLKRFGEAIGRHVGE